jgi:Kdo2-lipid IVA lauroyltransferase/acyltransferase
VAAVTAVVSAEPLVPRWYGHGLNRASAYRLAALVSAALPRAARLALAAALGPRIARWLPAERAVVRANVARLVPTLTASGRERLVGDVFRHFAMCFADLVSTNRRQAGLARLLAAVEGGEGLDTAAAGGRGTILLTAHLGNWELGGRLLALDSARPTHVVVAAEVDPAVQRFLRGGPAPVRFVTRSDPTAALGLLAALRRNEIVAMQGDRALGTRGDVSVDFFGAPARFPLGPFLLARAAGAPIVSAFCALGADRRYTITLGAPLHVVADGERAALARWVSALEAAVRRHPEQWFNFFDVWSGAPGR